MPKAVAFRLPTDRQKDRHTEQVTISKSNKVVFSFFQGAVQFCVQLTHFADFVIYNDVKFGLLASPVLVLALDAFFVKKGGGAGGGNKQIR